jgi:hypothetical protein
MGLQVGSAFEFGVTVNLRNGSGAPWRDLRPPRLSFSYRYYYETATTIRCCERRHSCMASRPLSFGHKTSVTDSTVRDVVRLVEKEGHTAQDVECTPPVEAMERRGKAYSRRIYPDYMR